MFTKKWVDKVIDISRVSDKMVVIVSKRPPFCRGITRFQPKLKVGEANFWKPGR